MNSDMLNCSHPYSTKLLLLSCLPTLNSISKPNFLPSNMASTPSNKISINCPYQPVYPVHKVVISTGSLPHESGATGQGTKQTPIILDGRYQKVGEGSEVRHSRKWEEVRKIVGQLQRKDKRDGKFKGVDEVPGSQDKQTVEYAGLLFSGSKYPLILNYGFSSNSILFSK